MCAANVFLVSFIVVLHCTDCAFDGANIFTARHLPIQLGRVHQLESRGRVFTVTIVSEKHINMGEKGSYHEVSAALNIILKKVQFLAATG